MILTTITPYWNRPEMLRTWLEGIRGAGHPDVRHILFVVGEHEPIENPPERMQIVYCPDNTEKRLSIGHWHNVGAKMAETEWMMKMDIDTLPNVRYFGELLKILRNAGPREWFNGGMVYVNQPTSDYHLNPDVMPVSDEVYKMIMGNQRHYCGPRNNGPAATNFICRTKIYLDLGGCDSYFRGYGWEDYQQIYMLEWHEKKGRCPLPGPIGLDNVTRRCCQEISRPKARALYALSPWLCLLHRFHPASGDPRYKTPEIVKANRQVLLDYILKRRRYTCPQMTSIC